MIDLYVIVVIGGHTVAIASDRIESVVDLAEITPVPRADGAVDGMVALRSRVATVIDTAAALGLKRAPDASRALIVRVEDHHYALTVDAADDVDLFTASPLSAGLRLDPAWATVACGLIERAGAPVLAVDLLPVIRGIGGMA